MGYKAAAALLMVREWETGGFFLKGTEAEAGRTGLIDDKAAVIKEQMTCLIEGSASGSGCDFFQIEWAGRRHSRVPTQVYDGTRGMSERKPSRPVDRLNWYEREMPGSLNAASSHAVGSSDRGFCGWRHGGIGAGACADANNNASSSAKFAAS
jgi:hypothetical protein